MRFTVSQADLATGLATAGKAVSTRNTLPILSGILVVADGDRLRLTATDLEIGIETPVPAQVDEEGQVVLPARYLTEIVRRVPAGPLQVEVDPRNFTASIRWERSQYTIHGSAADQFPHLPRPEGDPDYRIGQATLRNAIRQTAFAISHDETRPILTGACFDFDPPALQVTATDGVRIAYRRAQVQALAGNPRSARSVLPARTLHELARLLQGDDDAVAALTLTDNQAFFDLGPVRLVSRLLEGQYPDVMRLIPQQYETVVRLDTQPFHDACERASLIARDGSGAIKLGIDGSRLTITSSAPEVGEVYEEVAASIEGKPLEIGLNPRYLTEGLRALDTEQFLFELTDNRKPTRLKAAEHEDFLYVVLPIVVL